MSNKRLFGLLGRNISHSFSPGYFNEKFKNEAIDAEYVLFDLPKVNDMLEIIKQHDNLEGFNVTIPYKKEVFSLLNEADDVAQSIGAVNVVKIFRSKDEVFLSGYNTDVIGFQSSLLPLIDGKKNLKALILGTGGASLAVEFVLNALNIQYQKVSRQKRSEGLTYDEITLETIAQTKLIINTTPLGMFPDVESCPDIPYDALTAEHILYDLIYNPLETLFMKKGKLKGATVKNGLEMLHLQAKAAWKIWNQ